MVKVNLHFGEHTILVKGWQLEGGVQLQIEAKVKLTDEQLMELARLTRVNTDALVRRVMAS